MLISISIADDSANQPGHVDGELTELFHSLADAPTAEETGPIISKIWQLWTHDTEDQTNLELMGRGVAFMQGGNLKIAEDVFTRIVERDPTYMEAWNKRATVRYVMGDLDGSEADIYEVLSREPRHFGALSGLGIIKFQSGHYADALAIYQDILLINRFSPDAVRRIPELQKLLRGDPA
jgi:tetratricopeptide (TPR) repeat protein